MNELSIRQVIDRKTQLEHQITGMINDFQKETGINIEHIDLDITQVQIFDGKRLNIVDVSIDARI